MRLNEEADWIRAQVGAQVGRRGRGNPYPDEVRRRAIEYFRARRKQKIAPAKICVELGIGLPTLRNWTTPKKKKTPVDEMGSVGFERLEIVNGATNSTRKEFVVRGPGGLCIEGLDLDNLTELIRRLS